VGEQAHTYHFFLGTWAEGQAGSPRVVWRSRRELKRARNGEARHVLTLVDKAHRLLEDAILQGKHKQAACRREGCVTLTS
jgi:hypothetical protein